MKIKPNKEMCFEKYTKSLNERLSSIDSDVEKDKEDFPSDKDIFFKWTTLFGQEISMWILLCCGDVVEYDQVPLEDFNFIVNRRGFTPRIINTLKSILIEIGIGSELKGE